MREQERTAAYEDAEGRSHEELRLVAQAREQGEEVHALSVSLKDSLSHRDTHRRTQAHTHTHTYE